MLARTFTTSNPSSPIEAYLFDFGNNDLNVFAYTNTPASGIKVYGSGLLVVTFAHQIVYQEKTYLPVIAGESFDIGIIKIHKESTIVPDSYGCYFTVVWI